MKILPCLDSDFDGGRTPPRTGRFLGTSRVNWRSRRWKQYARGRYLRSDGAATIWRDAVAAAVRAKVSIPPTADPAGRK